MDHSILNLLENNARLTARELSVFTGRPEEEIAAEIKEWEDSRVICGYNTLIDWEKTDREYITALVEVKVSPARGQGFDRIAERIYRFDEVRSVYLMSGGFDLTVIVECKTMKDVAHFISDKLAPLESILSVATHFVLKKYKEHGVELNREASADERMIVSP
ncbi:MAG: Lrp/AsnC family transcriptional regulator [Clostridiales bacterium]|nr:Lrp/AsnC family transcriptional regulator [Clostridiales bacterium]